MWTLLGGDGEEVARSFVSYPRRVEAVGAIRRFSAAVTDLAQRMPQDTSNPRRQQPDSRVGQEYRERRQRRSGEDVGRPDQHLR
jgi:hypothetical protein